MRTTASTLCAFIVLTLGWAVLPHAALAQGGVAVDACANSVVDWDNNAEETVCIYGDMYGLTGYAEADIFNGPGQFWGYVADLAVEGDIQGPTYGYLPNTINYQYPQYTQSYTSGTAAPAANGLYTLNGYYTECYDWQGTDGNEYPCAWLSEQIGPSVSVDLEESPAVVDPLYQVTSIIYAPPGNKSSAGYTSTTTNGTTTTTGNSVANSSTVTFTEGFSIFGTGSSLSESFGVAESSSDTTAFQEIFSDATSVSNQSNSGNPNTANHDEDLILIWLNPELTYEVQGGVAITYGVGLQPLGNGGAAPPDIIEVTAGTMLDDGSGNTTVEPGYLIPQVIPSPINGAPVTLPGLAAVCKNVNLQEYEAAACTLADQCGCVPSDFANIVAQDPLLNYNGTGNPYPGNMSPLEADASGASACLNPSYGADCRYVPVPATKGSSQVAFQQLQGPQQGSGGNGTANTFTQTDATTTTQTLGASNSESVGASIKYGAAGFSLAIADTVTWQQSESTGTASGSGNSQIITLNSATPGCIEDVNIYEDTVYHTFVFQEPPNIGLCP